MKEFKDKHASEKMQVSQLRTDYKFTKKKRVALADTLNPKRISTHFLTQWISK